VNVTVVQIVDNRTLERNVGGVGLAEDNVDNSMADTNGGVASSSLDGADGSSSAGAGGAGGGAADDLAEGFGAFFVARFFNFF